MLTIQGVTKTFRTDDGQEVRAVDGLTLSVPAGQYVALLGPNGSGKTTTFRIVSGQLAPDVGAVSLDGRPITVDNDSSREIAHVPQEPRSLSFPEMTLQEHFLLAERAGYWARFWCRGITRSRQEHYRTVLKEYELDPLCEKLATPLGALSGGWQQVFALFLAATKGRQVNGLRSPGLLLLDEPTAALDAENKSVCLNLIQRLHAEGRTVLHATHDLPLALDLAQRFCIIKHGRVVRDRLASEVVGVASLEVLLQKDLPATFDVEPTG